MALESEASFPFALSCLALNVNQVVIPHSSLFVRFPAHRTYFENPHPNVDQQRKTTNKPGREKEAKRGSKTRRKNSNQRLNDMIEAKDAKLAQTYRSIPAILIAGE